MKIGDYVRTDIGEIRKVVRVTDDLYVLDKDVVFAHKDKIKKSSPNIIDLIKVGDYVNGNKIIKTTEDFAGRKIIIYGFDDGKHQVANAIYEEDIKSIVTKEQFESVEYNLESEVN